MEKIGIKKSMADAVNYTPELEPSVCKKVRGINVDNAHALPRSTMAFHGYDNLSQTFASQDPYLQGKVNICKQKTDCGHASQSSDFFSQDLNYLIAYSLLKIKK